MSSTSFILGETFEKIIFEKKNCKAAKQCMIVHYDAACCKTPSAGSCALRFLKIHKALALGARPLYQDLPVVL
jgi:hypothetical protein